MATSGIYKLTFSSGDTYIGQTGDIKTRWYGHKTQKGKGSPKLQQAWIEYGEPVLEVLEYTNDLDEREQYWISTLFPTLNVLPGGDGLRGLNHPRTRYTKTQILQVVELYTTTGLTHKEISNITGVGYNIVQDIIHGRVHHWATENIDLKSYERKRNYKVWDPNGKVYEATTLRDLESKTGISHSQLYHLTQVSKSGKGITGWTAYPPQFVELTSPEGEVFCSTTHHAKTFLKECGLSDYQAKRLTEDFKSSAGWKTTLCS